MGGSSKTVSSGATGATANLQGQVYNAAEAAAAKGAPTASPYLTQAATGLQGAAAAGAAGTNALATGDYSQFMNPYQGQVIDNLNKQWAQQNAGTVNQVDNQATTQNAFGGSRSGVAEGTALAQNNMNQANQVGNLEYQGFNNATAQAMQQANMGLGANSALAGVGQYNNQLAYQQALFPTQALAAGMAGGGQGASQQTTQTSGNPMSAILGGIGLAGSLIPGVGGLFSGNNNVQAAQDAYIPQQSYNPSLMLG